MIIFKQVCSGHQTVQAIKLPRCATTSVMCLLEHDRTATIRVVDTNRCVPEEEYHHWKLESAAGHVSLLPRR